MKKSNHFELLLAEDNPGDIRLIQEVLKTSTLVKKINVVYDGAEALMYLKKKDVVKPDLILLDINLPKRNGIEVLSEIKNDNQLKHIPVIILSSSESTSDIEMSYYYHANCFLSKPVNFDEFYNLIKMVEKFWLSVAMLPEH